MAQPPSDPDAEGLEIANVPAGSTECTCTTPVGYVASMRCGETDLHEVESGGAAGGTMPPIEVVLRDDGGGGRLARSWRSQVETMRIGTAPGRVTDMFIFCQRRERAEMKQTFVQRNGEFQMTQLPPGTYRVVAFETPKSDLEWSNEEAMKRYETQTVTVAPGQKEKIRISLSVE